MTSPIAEPTSNPLVGIGLKVASVSVFVTMSTMIKYAGPLPAGEIVFFRSGFAIFPIVLILAMRGKLRHGLKTSRPLGHVLRGSLGVISMWGGFFALTRLPLPETIVINYAQPLMVIVFSAVLLNETIRVYRWSAVVVGLVGVAIVAWPSLTLLDGPVGGDQALGVIAGLCAAASAALVMIQIRSLVKTESTSTTVLWFSLTGTVMAFMTFPFGWEPLSTQQALLLGCAGVCGGFGQLLMTEAYRHAEASVVAPFEYSSLILGVAFGYTVFGEIPDTSMLVGGPIVVAAGLFIIWRERQLGLPRTKARKATPPQ